jgi:glycosyltransferase involved in cell wall biosynthesis
MVPELHLVIAGNDEEKYLPRLMALAHELGIVDRVLFVGPVNDIDKWALYENAEMFVLPSYSENFGNVVAEAMSMACPVVVTPEVGLADFVRATGAGIVTDGEPKSLAAVVQALHLDKVTRHQMGQRARQAVIEKLSWDTVAEQMDRIYSRQVG